MRTGIHRDIHPQFEEVDSLRRSKNIFRGNPVETTVMEVAAKVCVHVLTINFLLHFLMFIFGVVWFDSTRIELLIGPVAEFFCCLIIALSFLMRAKLDDNEDSMIPGVQVHHVLQQFRVLMDHISIFSAFLFEKLRQTLHEIESCIEKDVNLRAIFISEEGLCHLLTLYDTQLQYQIEELLLANSKGFILAMYYAGIIIDNIDNVNANGESKIFRLESPRDVYRLIKFLWMLSKICAANIKFIKTSLEHETANKVLADNISIQLASRTVPYTSSIHRGMDNEFFRVIVSLCFTGFRYVGGAFLVYMSGVLTLPMWILIDIVLSEILFGRACSTECNSLPLDNLSPVQYLGFIRRCFTTGLPNYLLYNQGYHKHSRVPTIAVLLLPGTVSFYLTIMTFNGWRVISSPFETLENRVGAFYFSPIFCTIPIVIFVLEQIFIPKGALNAATGSASLEV